MINIARSIAILANRFPKVIFVLPVHPNPAVSEIFQPILSSLENVFLLPPLGYDQTIWLIKKAVLILTDSGGIQEEAPVFGTPVLVLRQETERSEGIDTGCAKLVGTDIEIIVMSASDLLTNEDLRKKMAVVSNPYGDGLASDRIQKILCKYVNL
jgi:UDP-N-acetylglucosamine 2-epimerase (non-hydrolysing)